MPAKKGHIISEETKKKISLSLLGRKHTLKRRRNISQSKLGRKWSDSERVGHINCHSGNKHYNWKGGRREDINGYVYLYSKNSPRGILEHRTIAENILGRKLTKLERVHHIDENTMNNIPSNLYVFKNQNAHRHYHTKLKNNNAPKLESNLCQK